MKLEIIIVNFGKINSLMDEDFWVCSRTEHVDIISELFLTNPLLILIFEMFKQ